MILLDKVSYYPELDSRFRNEIRTDLDLSIDVTKFEKEKGRGIKISNFTYSFI